MEVFTKQSKLKLILAPLFSASLLMLSGCGSDGGGSSGNTTPVQQQAGTLMGQVIDGETLLPLQQSSVLVNGTQVMTDAEGRFRISNLRVNQTVTVMVKKQGYINQVLTAAIASDNATSLNVRLQASDGSVTGNPNNEVIVAELDGNARVGIPARSLVRADGGNIVGDVTVQIAKVSPALDPMQMPGGYGIVGGGFMESFGAMIINAMDAAGNEVDLRDGEMAQIQIPVSTRSVEVLAQTMPLFFYNAEQQGWVQTGQAQLQVDAEGNQFYVGEIDQIGPWNIDRRMEVVNVNGCVEDTKGNRVGNAVIQGDGINYSAITTAYSSNTGNFSLPVRRQSQMYVIAQEGTRSSNAVSVTTTAADHDMNECLVVSASNNSVTMRLTWGDSPSDVDSHLMTPDGKHIYFSEKGHLASHPFANLDVDDTDSFGPEVVTIRKLMIGTYHYGVHNYSGTKNPALIESPVRVVLDGAKVLRRTIVPTGSEITVNRQNMFWHAFDLRVDAQCNVTYVPVNQWLASETDFDQIQPNQARAQYCQAD